MTTEAKRRANAKYDRMNTKQIKLKLNIYTDADIIERLASCPNVSGYIKSLVRADIKEHPDLFAE